MHDPSVPHLLTLKFFLWYLKGTITHGLHIGSSSVDCLVSYLMLIGSVILLLLELYCPLSCATVIFCDKVSAMYLASNHVQHQQTKHVERDLHFVREHVAIGHVRILHVPFSY